MIFSTLSLDSKLGNLTRLFQVNFNHMGTLSVRYKLLKLASVFKVTNDLGIMNIKE